MTAIAAGRLLGSAAAGGSSGVMNDKSEMSHRCQVQLVVVVGDE
jgi:hypothetical protein